MRLSQVPLKSEGASVSSPLANVAGEGLAGFDVVLHAAVDFGDVHSEVAQILEDLVAALQVLDVAAFDGAASLDQRRVFRLFSKV